MFCLLIEHLTDIWSFGRIQKARSWYPNTELVPRRIFARILGYKHIHINRFWIRSLTFARRLSFLDSQASTLWCRISRNEAVASWAEPSNGLFTYPIVDSKNHAIAGVCTSLNVYALAIIPPSMLMSMSGYKLPATSILQASSLPLFRTSRDPFQGRECHMHSD